MSYSLRNEKTGSILFFDVRMVSTDGNHQRVFVSGNRSADKSILKIEAARKMWIQKVKEGYVEK